MYSVLGLAEQLVGLLLDLSGHHINLYVVVLRVLHRFNELAVLLLLHLELRVPVIDHTRHIVDLLATLHDLAR